MARHDFIEDDEINYKNQVNIIEIVTVNNKHKSLPSLNLLTTHCSSDEEIEIK